MGEVINTINTLEAPNGCPLRSHCPFWKQAQVGKSEKVIKQVTLTNNLYLSCLKTLFFLVISHSCLRLQVDKKFQGPPSILQALFPDFFCAGLFMSVLEALHVQGLHVHFGIFLILKMSLTCTKRCTGVPGCTHSMQTYYPGTCAGWGLTMHWPVIYAGCGLTVCWPVIYAGWGLTVCWPVTYAGWGLTVCWHVTYAGGELTVCWPVTYAGCGLTVCWPVT